MTERSVACRQTRGPAGCGGDNAGGLAFSVWGGEAARAMVEDNYFLKYTYAYRLDGKDIVLKEPFFARETQFVYWNTVKE